MFLCRNRVRVGSAVLQLVIDPQREVRRSFGERPAGIVRVSDILTEAPLVLCIYRDSCRADIPWPFVRCYKRARVQRSALGRESRLIRLLLLVGV